MEISVILPVYNVEGYLEKCLESLTESTLNHNLIEFIFVNDGSTDNSLNKLMYWKEKDKRVKVINRKNEGAGYSRNFGLSISKGKYIYFMDPDDWISSEVFEKFLLYVKDISFQMDVFLFGFRVYEGDRIIRSQNNRKNKLITNSKEISKDFDIIFSDNSFFVVWNKIYKKSFLEENNIKFSNQKTGQDALFNIKVLSVCEKMLITDQIYYNYRFNRVDSAQNNKKYNKFDDNINIFFSFKNLVESKKIITNLHYLFFINILFKSLRENNYKYSLNSSAVNDILNRLKYFGSVKNRLKILYIKTKLLLKSYGV